MVWSTVLNAVDKSSRMSVAKSPRSTVAWISDSTGRMVVSDEWPGRKPN
jgi:hypothetical protein